MFYLIDVRKLFRLFIRFDGIAESAAPQSVG